MDRRSRTRRERSLDRPGKKLRVPNPALPPDRRRPVRLPRALPRCPSQAVGTHLSLADVLGRRRPHHHQLQHAVAGDVRHEPEALLCARNAAWVLPDARGGRSLRTGRPRREMPSRLPRQMDPRDRRPRRRRDAGSGGYRTQSERHAGRTKGRGETAAGPPRRRTLRAREYIAAFRADGRPPLRYGDLSALGGRTRGEQGEETEERRHEGSRGVLSRALPRPRVASVLVRSVAQLRGEEGGGGSAVDDSIASGR
mmetsp:Transcript_6819/g.14702  ORF Transcript_6819/g.14702 Transcript_6819/m.14702 type:complete len:254 (-) Transcript_6819:404-1165(-)